MTSIRYFVPEDGDNEHNPNVFLAPKPRQPGYPPTLREIKDAFPLPGRYHFRFKSPLVPGSDREKGTLAVWLDCVDDRQAVPTWKSMIVAKVTRIGVEDEEDDDDDFVRPTSTSAPVPAPAPRPAPAPVPSPSLDLFDTSTSPNSGLHSQNSMSAPPSANTGSFFDDHHHHTPPSVTTAKSNGSDNLLDMNFGAPAPAAAHADFFGMTTAPSPPVSGNYPPPQQQQQRPAMQQPPYRPQQPASNNNNAFNSFSQQSGPFGGLGTPWK